MPLNSLNFQDLSLFELALTHSSCSKDNPQQLNNERLEFYGDAVLKLIFSKYLFYKFPDSDEGVLTRYRARLISDALLADIAHEIGVDNQIKVGSSLAGKPKLPASVIGDSLEAIIGAVYIDKGFDAAENFVLLAWEPHIENAIRDAIEKDYKSLLQEKIQRDHDNPPDYKTLGSSGPDHNKEFEVGVYAGDKLLGQASGKSKKEAGQNAAKVALESLNGA
ncbi:MAG: ribonuclease III [Candidatus Melainabacteria bacterium]|nr:ribonuclease III [Candidatus Melainabacteria bacterium]